MYHKIFRELPRHCADQLIQDAIMYRFLVFRDQEKVTWKDQIAFTESMGDGNAHMETKSPGRKVLRMMSLEFISLYLHIKMMI